MKYLKFIIENEQIQEYIETKNLNIEPDAIKEFYRKKEQQVYENLDLFLTPNLNESYYNIRNFIINDTISYINEITLKAIGLGTVVAGSIYLYKQLEDFWESSVKPIKSIFVSIDDNIINKVTNSASSEDKPVIQKSFDSLLSPTEFGFLNNPLFLLFLLAGSIYSGSKIAANYNTIRKIAALKDNFDAIFMRLDALGVKEALPAKQFNEEKYTNHIAKCPQTKEKTFGALSINIGCPLDAYLTYCSSMLLSLAGIYLGTLKEKKNISSMMNLLAVKENFMINQFLTSMYNQFSFALEFIYADDPSIKSKWLDLIDRNVVDLSKKFSPSTSPQSSQPTRYYDRSGDKRFNRNN